MAYTQTDLDNIQAAIAGGELTVKIGDRLVTYRSIDDLLKASRVISSSINSTAASGPARHQLADFS